MHMVSKVNTRSHPDWLGPYCLQYRLPKNLSRQEEQTAKFMTGRLGVKH